jgi:DNA-binding transcriptional MerR regulator
MDRNHKLYYKIGEACRALDIQPYVLRYWETEFPVLAPTKSKSGQRVYAEKELDIIRRIKVLLYDEGYTIAGAKKKLDSELAGEAGPAEPKVSTPPSAPAASAPMSRAPARAKPTKVPSLPLPLDTPDPQRIETRRQGIEVALAEARQILALLDSSKGNRKRNT